MGTYLVPKPYLNYNMGKKKKAEMAEETAIEAAKKKAVKLEAVKKMAVKKMARKSAARKKSEAERKTKKEAAALAKEDAHVSTPDNKHQHQSARAPSAHHTVQAVAAKAAAGASPVNNKYGMTKVRL